MTLDGTPYPATTSPPEAWDALPDAAKWQIILFIGFLEMWSEMAGTHYMRGGQPGKFPAFKDHPELIWHPVPFNLYDPFNLHKNKSAAAKERGLISELNNGRLAQIGILYVVDYHLRLEIRILSLSFLFLLLTHHSFLFPFSFHDSGFLAEQKVPGSVPLLSGLGSFPAYDGEVMAPF